jgi:hypothetical protein
MIRLYDPAADLYRCPAGRQLRPMPSPRHQQSGKLAIRYASRRSVCRSCPPRRQCLSPKRDRREIERWVHQEVIERHGERMRARGEEMMRHRKALAEHPFGTLKCRAGYRHFLVRGLARVRGEWSLMALCYNFSRVLRILGFDGWMAALARRAAASIMMLLLLLFAACRRASQNPAAMPSRSARPRRAAPPLLAVAP